MKTEQKNKKPKNQEDRKGRARTMKRGLFFGLAILAMALVPTDLRAAQRITLHWTVPEDPQQALLGYRIYHGTASGVYDSSPLIELGKDVTSHTITDLADNQVHYFALRSFDELGQESTEYSKEISTNARALEWKDYIFDFTLMSADNDSLGPVFRYIDQDNYYRVRWDSERAVRRLEKCEGGVFTVLDEDHVSFQTGVTYSARIVAYGSNLEFWVNDALVLQANDSSHSEGTVGFYCWGNVGSYFDNVRVTHYSTLGTLLADDFEGSGLVGWQAVDQGISLGPSLWTIAASKKLLQNSNIYTSELNTALPKLGTMLYSVPWKNYEFTFTLSSADNDSIGAMFRYQDDRNYYRFRWDRERSVRRLEKCEGGVFTVLDEDSVPFQMVTTYSVKIVANGSTLEVWVNDGLVLGVYDATFAEGVVALYCWGNVGSYFDNVLVRDIPTQTVLFSENFDGAASFGWQAVDQGTSLGPSTWTITASQKLLQNSNVYTPEPDAVLSKLGTYLFRDGSYHLLQ